MYDTYASKNQKTKRERQTLAIYFLPDKQATIDASFFTYSVTGADFEDLYQESLDILTQLRKHVEKEGWDLSNDSRDFTSQLGTIGRAMYNLIFPEPVRQKIATFDQEAEKNRRGLRLLLVQPQDFKPCWEMLYMGENPEDIRPEFFWGARYPLGRNQWDAPSRPDIHLGEGLLTAIHEELGCSRREVGQIDELLAACTGKKLMWLEKLLPEKEMLGFTDIMRVLKENLDYGLIHFACHCEDFHSEGASKAKLLLTIHHQQLPISLRDLIAEPHGFCNDPFFFLNACETQTPAHPLQSLSFPTNLLKLKAGGVIATSCLIPDKFASVFAREFYRRLFQRSSRDQEQEEEELPEERNQYIAEVLMETRRYFLDECKNPLGLAYGLYGSAEQLFHFY